MKKLKRLTLVQNLAKYSFLLFFFQLVTCPELKSQVTIGSLKEPAKGALLDLKQQDATSPGGVTATKGLGLPRVHLANLDDITSISGVGVTAQDKAAHIGLMVYNTNPAYSPCAYVWTGTKWVSLCDDGSSSTSCPVTFSGDAYTEVAAGATSLSNITATSCCTTGIWSVLSASGATPSIQSNSSGSVRFNINITANTSHEPRSIPVTITDDCGNTGYYIILQKGASALCDITYGNSSNATQILESGAGVMTTAIYPTKGSCCTTNNTISYSATGTGTGVTLNGSASASGSFTSGRAFTVAFTSANTDTEPRVVVVTFTDACGNKSSFTAVQKGITGGGSGSGILGVGDVIPLQYAANFLYSTTNDRYNELTKEFSQGLLTPGIYRIYYINTDTKQSSRTSGPTKLFLQNPSSSSCNSGKTLTKGASAEWIANQAQTSNDWSEETKSTATAITHADYTLWFFAVTAKGLYTNFTANIGWVEFKVLPGERYNCFCSNVFVNTEIRPVGIVRLK